MKFEVKLGQVNVKGTELKDIALKGECSVSELLEKAPSFLKNLYSTYKEISEDEDVEVKKSNKKVFSEDIDYKVTISNDIPYYNYPRLDKRSGKRLFALLTNYKFKGVKGFNKFQKKLHLIDYLKGERYNYLVNTFIKEERSLQSYHGYIYNEFIIRGLYTEEDLLRANRAILQAILKLINQGHIVSIKEDKEDKVIPLHKEEIPFEVITAEPDKEEDEIVSMEREYLNSSTFVKELSNSHNVDKAELIDALIQWSKENHIPVYEMPSRKAKDIACSIVAKNIYEECKAEGLKRVEERESNVQCIGNPPMPVECEVEKEVFDYSDYVLRPLECKVPIYIDSTNDRREFFHINLIRDVYNLDSLALNTLEGLCYVCNYNYDNIYTNMVGYINEIKAGGKMEARQQDTEGNELEV